jgi:ParB-like chromosome segregation protein Spo0J
MRIMTNRLASRVSLLVALSLAAPLGGCLYTTSKVEVGEAPTTGVADYDAFFKEVVEIRNASTKAEQEEAASRQRLAVALGLTTNADVDDTVEAAQDRAKQLRDNGIQLHLELTPEPRLVKVEGTIPLDGEGQNLLKVVEESAKSSLDLSRRLGPLPERVTKLEKKRIQLLGSTKQAFRNAKPTKRREIERELDAAEEVLGEASQISAKYAGLASKFVLDLANAVETGGGAAALAQAGKSSDPPPAAPAKPVPRWRGPPRRPPPAAAQPPATQPASATPAPATKSKPQDDFDP